MPHCEERSEDHHGKTEGTDQDVRNGTLNCCAQQQEQKACHDSSCPGEDAEGGASGGRHLFHRLGDCGSRNSWESLVMTSMMFSSIG
jgi:hypothetical protein